MDLCRKYFEIYWTYRILLEDHMLCFKKNGNNSKNPRRLNSQQLRSSFFKCFDFLYISANFTIPFLNIRCMLCKNMCQTHQVKLLLDKESSLTWPSTSTRLSNASSSSLQSLRSNTSSLAVSVCFKLLVNLWIPFCVKDEPGSFTVFSLQI